MANQFLFSIYTQAVQWKDIRGHVAFFLVVVCLNWGIFIIGLFQNLTSPYAKESNVWFYEINVSYCFIISYCNYPSGLHITDISLLNVISFKYTCFPHVLKPPYLPLFFAVLMNINWERDSVLCTEMLPSSYTCWMVSYEADDQQLMFVLQQQ